MRRNVYSVAITTLAFAATLVLTVIAIPSAQAQTLTVLHDFRGEQDGLYPNEGLTMDRAGHLYGVTLISDDYTNAGVVFSLVHQGSGWVFATLHDFTQGDDGRYDDGYEPSSRLVIGPDGTFYGTTSNGNGGYGCPNYGCGVVFNLRPPAHACVTALCPWTETVLYRFTGSDDGGEPYGALIFDEAGNIYGTTSVGGGGPCAGIGTMGCGVVFKLVPSNGGWTESVLYRFAGPPDGYCPESGVIFDQSGNLYGTTVDGGSSDGCDGAPCGTVFELSPSGSGWTENIIHTFQGSDGDGPISGLIFDAQGNLYGATAYDIVPYNGGTVFMLTPSNGNWAYSQLYAWNDLGPGGTGPWDRLFMDAAGNLYGTTLTDGLYGYGSVFELTPGDGGWSYTSLHDFTGGDDGAKPEGNVIRDASGNLYGTTLNGGTSDLCMVEFCGVAFEITP